MRVLRNKCPLLGVALYSHTRNILDLSYMCRATRRPTSAPRWVLMQIKLIAARMRTHSARLGSGWSVGDGRTNGLTPNAVCQLRACAQRIIECNANDMVGASGIIQVWMGCCVQYFSREHIIWVVHRAHISLMVV